MPISGIGGTEFPRIGTIRKGDSKESGKSLNKRDLGPVFRVIFNGADERTVEAQERFITAYGSLQPEEIDAIFTVDSPEEGNTWRFWLEAYDKGALVLQTDGVFIQYQRDRKTGLAMVRNGRDVETGECVRYDGSPAYSYYSKKKKVNVPVYPKAHGYLRIIVPALRRLAYLELRTTSFWDCDNIDKNLRAIAHAHGSLKGIPCIVRRRLTPVSKPLDNGKRFWDDEWLVFVEAAPEWVDDKLAQLEAGAYSPTYQLADGTEQDAEPTAEPVEAEVIDAPPAEEEIASKPEAETLPEDFDPAHCTNFTEMAQAAVELLGYKHSAHVLNALKQITGGDSNGLSYADMWTMLVDHQAAKEAEDTAEEATE